jgi:hypothetical protein
MDDAVTASQENHPSEKQFAANRANAARSTGPRTEEGKARSRLNALKHGLLATEAANFGVEGEAARKTFEGLSDRLENYYRPRGPIEEILVQKIAIVTWRLKRVMRFEARAMHHASLSEEDSYRIWSARHKGRRHPSRNKMRDWGIDGALIPEERDGGEQRPKPRAGFGLPVARIRKCAMISSATRSGRKPQRSCPRAERSVARGSSKKMRASRC